MGVTVSHTEIKFPERTFTNEDFFSIFPEEKESKTWPKLGIKNRYIIDEDKVASDLAIEAAQKLLKDFPELKKSIDFILFTSPERDYYTPITAGVIQDKLGLSNQCGCLDVHQGCSAFTYLVAQADGLISVGAANQVLVLAVSPLSRKIHPKDKANRFLFGDAAAAFVISKNESKGFHSYYFRNDGSQKDRIIVQDGEYRNPLNEKSDIEFKNQYGESQIPAYFYQNGSGVFRFTLDQVPKMINEILLSSDYQKDDIDLYLLHQPNVFMVKTLAKFAKLDENKVIIDVADYGNTGSMTIPIMIHNLKQKKKIQSGMKILIAAFGVGLSWNGCIWET